MEQKQAAGIVLSEYDPIALAEAGAKLVIVDERGKPTESWIQLKGADSDTYQEAFREQQRKRSAAMTKARRMKLPTPEEIEADALDLLAIATEGWGGIYSAPDVALACSVESARRLYRARPDIREQVDQFVNDRLNFLPSAASG